MANELCDLGVFELARLYRRRELSPVEVITAHLQRCDRLNPILNAFLVLFHDSAIEAGRAAEALFRAGIDLGPLQGVPISVKDLIRVKGTRTTAGSKVLLGEPPDQSDAVVVHRFRAAGAIVLGKTNLNEFAAGDPDPTGPFGLVQNPRRIGHYAGGSSTGAGAAVAAGLGVIGLGTDTGGSVRIPACLCGVSGVKPTTGQISLEGIIPLSWSLDTVGPLARRVRDVAAALAVCSGRSLQETVGNGQSVDDFLDIRSQQVRNWRIGILVDEYFVKMQLAVSEAFKNTLQALRDLGCQLIDLDSPGIEVMHEIYTPIIQAEGSAYHERYRENEHLYGTNFRERILPGRETKARVYLDARQRQLEFQQEWLSLSSRVDVVIAPTVPAVAPPHGINTIQIGDESFPFRLLLARFTRPFNILGWPALTIPNGVSAEGLPTGLQIAGPPQSEERLLILGHQLEHVLGLLPQLRIEPRYGM